MCVLVCVYVCVSVCVCMCVWCDALAEKPAVQVFQPCTTLSAIKIQ